MNVIEKIREGQHIASNRIVRGRAEVVKLRPGLYSTLPAEEVQHVIKRVRGIIRAWGVDYPCIWAAVWEAFVTHSEAVYLRTLGLIAYSESTFSA